MITGLLAVADLAALEEIPVSGYSDGTVAFVQEENANFLLYKALGLPVDGVNCVAPAEGNPIAGAPDAKWVRLPLLPAPYPLDVGKALVATGHGTVGWEGGVAIPPNVFFGDGTIQNLEPAPRTVRYGARLYPLPLAGVHETAAIYMRNDPSVAEPQTISIYLETTEHQIAGPYGSFGPAIKHIHRGAGQGTFTALYGGGTGHEVAAWTAGRGYTGTLQAAGLVNHVHFEALQCSFYVPGVAPNIPALGNVPNYGMFYANQSPGHAFTARKFVGCDDGVAQIRLVEYDLAQHRWRLFNSGGTLSEALDATAGAPLQESPETRIRAKVWDGAASQSLDAIFKVVVESASPLVYSLRMYLGPVGSETLVAVFRPTTTPGETYLSICDDTGTLRTVLVDGSDFLKLA